MHLYQLVKNISRTYENGTVSYANHANESQTYFFRSDRYTSNKFKF